MPQVGLEGGFFFFPGEEPRCLAWSVHGVAEWHGAGSCHGDLQGTVVEPCPDDRGRCLMITGYCDATTKKSKKKRPNSTPSQSPIARNGY